MFRHDGVAGLAAAAGERVSMVWSTLEEHAARLLELARDELVAEVAAESHGAVGDLQLITRRPRSAAAAAVRQLVLPRLA